MDLTVRRTKILFQSTRPRGTRLLSTFLKAANSCFNPRVREGRDEMVADVQQTIKVSIHASARDATSLPGLLTAPSVVSIHASARDATKRHPSKPHRWSSFNPRVREGRDTQTNSGTNDSLQFQSTRPRGTRLSGEPGKYSIYVSIHASARDATLLYRPCERPC